MEFSKIQKKYTINDKPEMIDFYMIQNNKKKASKGGITSAKKV